MKTGVDHQNRVSLVTRVWRYLKTSQPATVSPPAIADIFEQVCASMCSVYSPLFMHCEIQRVNHVGLQRFFLSQDKRCMPALRSVRGRMDEFEPEKYRHEMQHVTLYQFLDFRNY